MKAYLYILIFYFLSIFIVKGQEGENFINIPTGNELIVPKNIIPIVDNTLGELSVLIKYRKSLKAYLFDGNKNLISMFEADIATNNTSNYIGSSSLNSKFNLLFTNNNNSKFERLLIDYKNKTVKTKTLDLNLKKEYLIGSFQESEILYLLSIIKDTSILKIYTLNLEGEVKEKKIDLSEETFKKFNGLETSLYYLITSNEKPSKTQSSYINYNVPNSLETTSSVNKIYFKDGIVTITNDNTSSHTTLIQVNIKDGDYVYNQIPKKGFLKEELRTESNSFILDNYFFSVYTTTDKMVFSVYDINTKSFIREYIVNDSDSITFKNTPIIKSNERIVKTKEYKNSARFFRDIVNSNLGISVYKRNDLFIVSIGGSEKEQSMNFAIVGGVLGGAIGAALFSTFDSYSRTTSIKIDCLFNEDFTHSEGSVPKNGFDKIKEFVISNKMKDTPLQTLFKYKEYYVWGFYNKKTGIYRFLKFKE